MVLKLMFEHNHISYSQMINAQNITIDEMLIKKEATTNDYQKHQYQAYLDIAYKQIIIS